MFALDEITTTLSLQGRKANKILQCWNPKYYIIFQPVIDATKIWKMIFILTFCAYSTASQTYLPYMYRSICHCHIICQYVYIYIYYTCIYDKCIKLYISKKRVFTSVLFSTIDLIDIKRNNTRYTVYERYIYKQKHVYIQSISLILIQT